MTCYGPLQAWRGKEITSSGKRKPVFRIDKAFADGLFPLNLPCGQCIGCRLEYSRQWAIRCMHEASLYEDNCFITLTYNDKFLPLHSSLNYDHWTKFMKRLRKRFSHIKIRFFMGPEYGDMNFRPHYHALLFNFDFADKELFMVRNGHRLYRSKALEELWTDPVTRESMGYSSVGSCTFESAAYVARYMMKKVKGEDHKMRYFTKVPDENGEVFPILPEKARMSRMPGIAHEWFQTWYTDVYNHDYVIMNGRRVRPPKFYDRIYESIDPVDFENIKLLRVNNAKLHAADQTPERLAVRCKVKEADISKLVRNIPL